MDYKLLEKISFKKLFYNKTIKFFKLFNPVSILRNTYLSISFFASKNILDLSASSAFYFFLSIIPMTLLIVYVLDISIAGYGKLSDYFFMLLSQINPELNKKFFDEIGLFNNERKSFYGIIGIVGLIWSSRSVFNGIRTTLDLIFLGKLKRGFLKDNLISLIFLPLVVIICILIFVIGVIVKNLSLLLTKYHIDFIESSFVISVYSNSTILILIFISSFCLYRFLPCNRPRNIPAIIGALLFTFFSLILQKGLYGIISLASYYLLYGVISTLIVGLFWVYILFAMFYFFAQLVYVLDNYNELEFINYCLCISGECNYLEKKLFKEPFNLISIFGKNFKSGDTIYDYNDKADYIYILIIGKVKIINKNINGEENFIVINNNSLFAENAILSTSNYNSTAIALEDSLIVVINRDFFNRVLILEPKIQQIILNSYLYREENI